MSKIRYLQPMSLWGWFDKICMIPHPSFHENILAKFITHWAKEKKFFVERDEIGNILIRKPATKGMENRQGIILQAHLDMVPQSKEGYIHNFQKDSIHPYIDGEWVKAKGTTLGADNGIGIASSLAILESSDIPHPELEVLLTVTEESGMKGALKLRPNWFKSRLMINTDAEENGEIYIGCAGGEDVTFSVPIHFEKNSFDSSIKISIKGLKGGHSGGDIHTNRVNAIKLLGRLLVELKKEVHFQLGYINGGSVSNAIPRESSVIFSFSIRNKEIVLSCIENITQKLQLELSLDEPNLYFIIENETVNPQIFDVVTTNKIIQCLKILPNGVIRYSDELKDVVETSLNVGVLVTDNDHIELNILVRSLVEEGKKTVRTMLIPLAELIDAKITFSGSTPGWRPALQSPITVLTKQIYDRILGYEAKIKVIHAGLECGLIKKIYPDIDIVSIGPTIRNAHSPDEKVHIPAVNIYWSLLTQILAQIPEKA
ncbi:aminoacyl-histidine dipeptidase [Avibacterium sp. 21-599]|uniref:aminoacyl-histidine dipeptidase n=1 Tax=Avibacterium sp. 21-599 TaxID=2911528 RepID=UPI002247156A|nr:aminoacyl-histidine dipeptidase [Avibacterium sp. 21-599]MCW9718373.1 aminoacyl-histidine dipeptidase [Avibacterium sp. 21-599]